jgi:hypothetical protein
MKFHRQDAKNAKKIFNVSKKKQMGKTFRRKKTFLAALAVGLERFFIVFFSVSKILTWRLGGETSCQK